MKKIVVFVGSLSRGGAERVASLWVRGFVGQGHDVSVVILDGNLPISYNVPDCVRIDKLDVKKEGIPRIFEIIRKLRKCLLKVRPDFVITVGHPLGALALASSFMNGIKVINTEHNAFERPVDMPFEKKIAFQKFFVNRFFYKVTVLTKVDLKCIGGKMQNVVYLPNPLTYEPSQTYPIKENVILTVARLESWYQKGLDLLISAWSQLFLKYPDWKLQILGNGDACYFDEVSAMIAKAGVSSSVELLGFVENPLVLYRKAAVYVLSSRNEGFGMAMLEAMSQGCACIACDFNGRQKEVLVSDGSGITCKPNDLNELELALDTLLSQDQNYRRQLGENAIRSSSMYELSHIMKMWDSILNNEN